MVGATGQSSASSSHRHPPACAPPSIWSSAAFQFGCLFLAFMLQHAGVSGVVLRMQSAAWH